MRILTVMILEHFYVYGGVIVAEASGELHAAMGEIIVTNKATDKANDNYRWVWGRHSSILACPACRAAGQQCREEKATNQDAHRLLHE